MRKINAIFCDLDGTIVQTGETLSKKTVKAFQRLSKKGIKVVLISGRVFHSIFDLAEKYKVGDAVLAFNGAYGYDCKKKEILFTDCLAPEDVKKMLPVIVKHGHDACFCTLKQWVGFLKEPVQKGLWDDSVDDTDIVDQEDIYKIEINVADLIVASKCMEEISALDLPVTITVMQSMYGFFLEICPALVNKGNALKKLCQLWDISPSHVVAFGDGSNDISMFQDEVYGVAVGNAVSSLKKAASDVTGNFTDDGVACWIDKNIK